jgi:hypothetical protein
MELACGPEALVAERKPWPSQDGGYRFNPAAKSLILVALETSSDQL